MLPDKQPRKVCIYDTKTQKPHNFTTTASTFKELKEDIKKAGVDLSNCVFTEPRSKLTLIEDGAVLPLVDFVLMRTPVSTKSGVKQVKISLILDTVKQCTEHVKTLIDKYPHAKEHFTGYSKLKLSELQDKIKSFSVKPPKVEKKVASKPTKEIKAKVEKTTSVKKETCAKDKTSKKEEKVIYPKWYTDIAVAIENAPELVKHQITQVLKSNYEPETGDVFDLEYVKTLIK